jgi:hypothetical protein
MSSNAKSSQGYRHRTSSNWPCDDVSRAVSQCAHALAQEAGDAAAPKGLTATCHTEPPACFENNTTKEVR